MLGGPVKSVQRTRLALKGRIHSSEKLKLPHRPIQLQWQGILDEELTADLSDSKRQKYRSKERQHSGLCSRDLHCLSLIYLDFTYTFGGNTRWDTGKCSSLLKKRWTLFNHFYRMLLFSVIMILEILFSRCCADTLLPSVYFPTKVVVC